MTAWTISWVVATSYNGSGNPWDLVWIPYNDEVDSVSPIPLHRIVPGSKDSIKDTIGLPCNRRWSLLNRDSFSEWEEDSKSTTEPHNVNVQFMFNGLEESVNIFGRLSREIVKLMTPKHMSGRKKSCRDPSSKIGFHFVIYPYNIGPRPIQQRDNNHLKWTEDQIWNSEPIGGSIPYWRQEKRFLLKIKQKGWWIVN